MALPVKPLQTAPTSVIDSTNASGWGSTIRRAAAQPVRMPPCSARHALVRRGGPAHPTGRWRAAPGAAPSEGSRNDHRSPEGPVLRLVLLTLLVLAASALPLSAAPAGPPPAPGAAAIARAEALAAQWGRCPTARPARRVLDQARRTTAPVPRARRARAALRAWTAVARECSRPVDQPEVIVPG